MEHCRQSVLRLLFFITFLKVLIAKCPFGQHECGNGECISSERICDGYQDCKDGNDEDMCNSSNFSCVPPKWFRCTDGTCIRASFVCDKYPHCPDESDEFSGCLLKRTIRRYKKPASNCLMNQFPCDSGKCIHISQQCDGKKDCTDGTDEASCPFLKLCKGFRCKNDNCVLNEYQCDGKDDCGDNSDEDSDCQNCTELGYYKYDRNLKKCVEIDKCQTFGFCSQKCNNTFGISKCYCDDGYILQSDNRTCKATGDEPILFYTTLVVVRGVRLHSNATFTVIAEFPITNYVSKVYYDGRNVYWTDIPEITRTKFRNFSKKNFSIWTNGYDNHPKSLVDTGLEEIAGLEIDYVTGNIYYTLRWKGEIKVCTKFGYPCIVIHKDKDGLGSLVLFPKKGIMFWAVAGRYPMIATSGMDGSNPKPFVAKEWADELALDISNDRLYWTNSDSQKIETVRLDGKDRKSIFIRTFYRPLSIAFFEDRMFWTSKWETIHIVNKLNTYKIISELDGDEIITDLHIYHPLLQPKVNNSCKPYYCSDICMLAPNESYTCGCRENTELRPDQRTCKGKPLRFAVGAGNTLYMIELLAPKNQDPIQHDLLGIDSIESMTYDSLTKSFIISDFGTKKLYRYYWEDEKLEDMNISSLGNIISMSFDSSGNNLYYCDENKNTVEVLSLTTKERITIYEWKNGKPISIVAVPERGEFFVVVQQENQKITLQKINLDGSYLLNIIDDEKGKISLAYDRRTDTIIHSNSANNTIISIFVDRASSNIFAKFNSSPISVASQDGIVLWANQESSNVFYQAITPEERHPEPKIIELGIDSNLTINIIAINEFTPYDLHPCQQNNGGCSHVCLVSKNNDKNCNCPKEMRLKKDNRTCETIHSCTDLHFKCSGNFCIPESSKCDGSIDCPNGEDENNCETKNCSKNEFTCSNGQCLPINKRCNNVKDCSDESDEHDCLNYCDGESHFRCGSGECIPKSKSCDCKNDCRDGSDENDCKGRQSSHTEKLCQSDKDGSSVMLRHSFALLGNIMILLFLF